MKINISNEILGKCPDIKIGIIEGYVSNSSTSEELWNELEKESQRISASVPLNEINLRPEILATRKAYKILGKDPNRYRPSAEALCRRIVRGLPLYQLNTLVDIINLVSIQSGFSIGGFDADLIQGDVCLGIGQQKEEFEAIGRGELNICGLPVYRDKAGGIGTPTSDHERTKISLNTTHLLMIINSYSGDKKHLEQMINNSIGLLKKYADLKEFTVYHLPTY